MLLPIKKLNNRHHRLILLASISTPVREIAQDLGMSVGRVQQLLRDPLISPLIAEKRTQFHDRILEDVQADLTRDLPFTIKRVRELRDQDEDRKVSLGACTTLLDRQLPKKTSHEETHITRITIEAKDRDRLKHIEQEILDVTPQADGSDAIPPQHGADA